jgi:hypothetical protein
MKFLGRQFDVQRNGWVYSDGSGFVPEEMRIEVMGQFDGRPYEGLRALLTKFEWDERLKGQLK